MFSCFDCCSLQFSGRSLKQPDQRFVPPCVVENSSKTLAGPVIFIPNLPQSILFNHDSERSVHFRDFQVVKSDFPTNLQCSPPFAAEAAETESPKVRIESEPSGARVRADFAVSCARVKKRKTARLYVMCDGGV